MRITLLGVLLVTTAAVGQRALAQTVLYRVYGDAAHRMGDDALNSAGDVDADGFTDLISRNDGDKAKGEAQVFSGRDGMLLHRLNGDAYSWSFGRSVNSAGDLDSDWPCRCDRGGSLRQLPRSIARKGLGLLGPHCGRAVDGLR